jgi:hypothetical protein
MHVQISATLHAKFNTWIIRMMGLAYRTPQRHTSRSKRLLGVSSQEKFEK